ncbi:hypothetical protein ACFLZB_04135 [Nanoarchaeota archaeon]
MEENPIVMKNLEKLLDHSHGLMSLRERPEYTHSNYRFQWLKLEDSQGKSMEWGQGSVQFNYSNETGEIFALEVLDPDFILGAKGFLYQHEKFGDYLNGTMGVGLMVSPEPIKSRIKISLGLGLSKQQIGPLGGNNLASFECRNNLKTSEFLFNLFQKYAAHNPEE